MSERLKSSCPSCGCGLNWQKRKTPECPDGCVEVVQIWCAVCGYFENKDGVFV